MLASTSNREHPGPRMVTWLDNLVTGGTLAPVSDRNSLSPSLWRERSADRTLPPGRSSTKARPLTPCFKKLAGSRLVADRFFHSHSDRPYLAESDPKCIPFSGERVPASLQLLRVRGTEGCQIRKCMHLQAGSVAAGGRPDCPERKKDNHPHEGSVTDLLHPSGTPSTKVSGTPSLLIQLELVDKTTLSRNKYGAV